MPTPVDRVAAELQGNYSVALYGAPNRVDVSSIRIVWLWMLPLQVLQVIGHSGGACKYDSGYPWRPFLVALDLFANPLDAVWISWERANVVGFPVSNYSWIEVTHCPQRGGFGWVFGPMWLYAAPGSGVSINVGRTVVMGYTDAARLLKRVYPGTLECQCESRCAFGMRTNENGTVNNREIRNGSSCISSHVSWQLLSSADTNGTGASAPPHASPRLVSYTRCWSRAQVIAELDTIQIINHLDYFSGEPRHEIVRLRHAGECGRLTPSTPDLMCGRAPHLMRCTNESAALRSINKCANAKAPLSHGVAAAMLNASHPGRCVKKSAGYVEER